MKTHDPPTRPAPIPARRLPIAIAALAAVLVLSAACGDEKTIWELRGSSTVTLSFQNLPPLSGGLNYQAWAIEFRNAAYWGSPMGIFNIDESGRIVDPTTGEVRSAEFEAALDAEDVFGVQVTLERSNVLVGQPSATFILGGLMVNGSAQLGQASWLSLTTDFSQISGKYFLATPTDAVPGNELSGVWFADYGNGTPTLGLELPQAPDGWDYEAWIVLESDTLSTGKFYYAGIADTLNLHGGLTGGHLFPGQDFILNPPEGLAFPTDLSGSPIFVTMEPWEEYDVEPLSPFGFRLLQATIPLDAQPHTTYGMTSLFDVLPRGTATIPGF